MIDSTKANVKGFNEILLAAATYEMSIPDSTQEKVESIPHGHSQRPFFNYKISFDGENFITPPVGQAGYNLREAYIYTDDDNIYFHYFYATTSNFPSAFTLYFQYKIYALEVST